MTDDMLQLELQCLDATLTEVRKAAREIGSDPRSATLDLYATRLSERRRQIAATGLVPPPPPDVRHNAQSLAEEIHRLARVSPSGGEIFNLAVAIVLAFSKLDLHLRPLLGPKGPPILDPDD